MARSNPIQTNFTAGELSPRLDGRVDLAKYANGVKKMENFIAQKHGPCSRRTGSVHVAEAQNSNTKSRLQAFEFSTIQAYIVEFEPLTARFFKDRGLIVTGTDNPWSSDFSIDFGISPVEVTTPYLESQLFELEFAQSADVLFITHPAHQPRKLSRTSDIDWTLTELENLDGPFLDVNVTDTTFTLSGTSGSVNVTASAVDGINDDQGFLSTDVGRQIRFKDPAGDWTWLEIDSLTSTTVVVATIKGPNASAGTATKDWRLGAWSDTTGFPTSVTFYEQRLCFAGTTLQPQTVFMSRSGDFENFAPTEVDGIVVDDNGIVYTLATDQVNAIRWMSASKTLAIGTTGGEFIASSGDNTNALTPDNIRVFRQTTYGSEYMQPVRIGGTVLFVQRAGRKIREYVYEFANDAYIAADLSILSEHITLGGIVDIAFQQETDQVIWTVRDDGTLLGLTYEREQEVVAWHRHVIGGSFLTGQAVVESVASIPSPNGDRDDLWIVVKRTVNNMVQRSIEHLADPFETGVELEDAIYLDGSLTFSGSASTEISGLAHLEGETVSILAQGTTHPDRVVSSGAITLERAVTKAQIGLAYESTMQTMKIEAGNRLGTAQGKKQRINAAQIRFLNTVGGKFGPDEDNLDIIFERDSSDLMDNPPKIFGTVPDTEDKRISFPTGWTDGAHFVVKQDQPLPMTIVSIMPEMSTNTRG